jgi:hypothetical protein
MRRPYGEVALVAHIFQNLIRPKSAAGFDTLRVRSRLLGVSLIATTILAATAALGGNSFPPPANNSPTPVFVELFTSEGCSSCPPADALLEQMDASQPVPGADLIVLSEHVDYWDHDGWKDPFSSPSMTGRQSAYVRALGLKTPYTPQILIDGSTELRASDEAQVREVLQKATIAPKVPIRIVSVTREAGAPSIVRGRVEADVNFEKHNAEIYLVVALDHAESQVARGENQGRHLTHVAVATEITKIGKLEKGKGFAQDFQLKLKIPQADSTNIRLVAFAQESGPGKVLGAASKKVAFDTGSH